LGLSQMDPGAVVAERDSRGHWGSRRFDAHGRTA